MLPLFPVEVRNTLPPLYAQEHEQDPVVYAKFFSPQSGWIWYMFEGSTYEDDFIFSGWVVGFEKERRYTLIVHSYFSSGTGALAPSGNNLCYRILVSVSQESSMQKLYYQAAWFPTEETSLAAYSAAQDLIYRVPCDLSVYRFLSEHRWHVVFLGTQPPPALQKQVTAILASGIAVTLPDTTLSVLAARREQEIQKGPWVEHHGPVRFTFGEKKKGKKRRK